MKNISEKLVIFLLALIIMMSGGALFFEDQFTALANLLAYDKYHTVDKSGETLTIAYLFVPEDLFPFAADPAVQTRLHDVYQSLIEMDENFNIRPALAVYYGLLSENTWSFRLRESVKFHDGTALDADDVIYSFEQAEKYSGVAADLVESVANLEKTDDLTVVFNTTKPDPLLLNKLSKLPIIPDGFKAFDQPIGTGPYKIVDSADLTTVLYQRNEKYWGQLPYFGKLEVLGVPDKQERVNGLQDGRISLLANVPPDSVGNLKEEGFNVTMMPSLEVGFVMFNFQDAFFAQKAARTAVATALNKDVFLEMAYGYAKTLNQFIPNGVFGYDPSIVGYPFDLIAAGKQMAKVTTGFEKVDIKLYYPDSLKMLGQFFQEQLREIGLNVEAIPMTDSRLQEQMIDSALPLYYLGWRNESGDALPFLKSVLHSKVKGNYGIYNGMNYKNEEVDRLIESAENDFNLKTRLESMQKAMKIAVEEDVVGVPLFETESIFAYQSDLYFKPRVDSLIYPSTIRKK